MVARVGVAPVSGRRARSTYGSPQPCFCVAIGTQEGPGDTIASIEASFLLLIFSSFLLHVLEYPHVRQLCDFVVARQRQPRSKQVSGRP